MEGKCRSGEPRRKKGSHTGGLLGAVCALLLRLGRALLRDGGVVCVLQLLIVLELCLLGTGVVRRLEDSYEVAEQTARMQLAAAEAQDKMREDSHRSVLNIGAVGTESEESEEASDKVPPSRARTLPDIILDLTGDAELAADLMEYDQLKNADAAAEHPEVISDEANEEVDTLIRRGVSAMIAGDMRRCVLTLEQAYSMAPNHPALLYYYGMAYDKLLNPAKAKEFYDKIFRMGDRAGKYFQRASRRLTYGVEQPAAMRGKLSFGPYKVQKSADEGQGEKVRILLPIMLAPGEEIRSDDVYIRVQIFELVNGRKIDFSREQPKYTWVNEKQTWENWEEDLIVTYEPSAYDIAEQSGAGDAVYYGFTAVLAYKGEPLDLISTPAALILHEQLLSNPRRGGNLPGLLPDDGLSPYTEEAVPYADEFEDNTPNYL